MSVYSQEMIIGGRDVRVIGDYVYIPQATIARTADGRWDISVGANDSACDWAAAWVEVDGLRVKVIGDDQCAPYQPLDAGWDQLVAGAANDEIVALTGALSDALQAALDAYCTAAAAADASAIAWAIDDMGLRCYIRTTHNTDALILHDPTTYTLSLGDIDGALEITPQEWAEQYCLYYDDINVIYYM